MSSTTSPESDSPTPGTGDSPPAIGRSRRTTTAGGNKRCWNCRERKTACDKSLPSCTNCRRRGVDCQGYGLKLSWPRKNDKRRSVHADHHCFPVRAKKLAFVNAGNPDVELWKGKCRVVSFPNAKEEALPQLSRDYRIPRSINLSFLSVRQIDPLQGTADPAEASRLISSCCDGMNELYPLLIRMSLSDELPPSIATRHALAALSHKFLGDQKTAMMHHAKAVSALQLAITRISTATFGEGICYHKFQAIAASLLLNTFEASPPDIAQGLERPSSKSARLEESSRAWGIFFSGSKQIASYHHVPHKTYDGDPGLVLDWLFYYDTMYKFSIRHWHPQDDNGHINLPTPDASKIVSKTVFSPMRQIILQITGCSLELLDLIHQTIDVVRDRSDPEHLSSSHLAALRRLEYRLTNVVQVLRVTSSSSPDPDGEPPTNPRCPLENRAELFRIAALIYLYRVAWNVPRSHPSVAPLIRGGIKLLKQITRRPPSPEDDSVEPAGERPFPLLVLGLEARTESERRVVVDAMDAAARARPLGNVAGYVLRMVYAGWVRADLYGDGDEEGEGEDMLAVYDGVVSGNRVPPFMA